MTQFGIAFFVAVFLLMTVLAVASKPKLVLLPPNHDGPAPDPSATPKNVSVAIGAKVSWMKIGENREEDILLVGQFRFTNDIRFSADQNPQRDQYNLVISNTQLSDAGTYECGVSTLTKRYIRINLDVNARIRSNATLTTLPPTEQTTSSGNSPSFGNVVAVGGTKFVSRGQRIDLSCNGTAPGPDAPEQLTWYKNGNRIDSILGSGILIENQRVGSTYMSRLAIASANRTHRGKYTCRILDSDQREIGANSIDVEVYNDALSSQSHVKRKATGISDGGIPTYDFGNARHGISNDAFNFKTWPSRTIVPFACLSTFIFRYFLLR